MYRSGLRAIFQPNELKKPITDSQQKAGNTNDTTTTWETSYRNTFRCLPLNHSLAKGKGPIGSTPFDIIKLIANVQLHFNTDKQIIVCKLQTYKRRKL